MLESSRDQERMRPQTEYGRSLVKSVKLAHHWNVLIVWRMLVDTMTWSWLGLVFVIGAVESLECYVCTDQETNTGKCGTTIKTCDYQQDWCLSEIRWGSTPYWVPQGAEKQYYISKFCANQTYCEQKKKEYIPHCHHIWYEDWKCVECCQGDRCNYYVTLGASAVQGNIALLIALLMAFFTWMRMWEIHERVQEISTKTSYKMRNRDFCLRLGLRI